MKHILTISILLLFSITTFCQVEPITKNENTLSNELNFREIKDSEILNTLLIGEWTGKGYQFNVRKSWTIKLMADEEANEFIIEYPSLNCSGYWEATSVTNSKIEFTEVITIGENKCITGGKIVLKLLDENRVKYLFYWPDDKTLNSKGEIRRIIM